MLNATALWPVLFTSIHSAIAVLDAERHILGCNPAFATLADTTIEQATGQTIDAVMVLLRPNHHKLTMPWSLLPSKQWRVNQQAKLPSGDIIPISYHVVAVPEHTPAVNLLMVRDARREQELIELRSEFVSIVSHQLRTPASAVKWYLETLIDNRRGNALNDWQVDKMHQAYQSNERMISLINDLLNVSRLDSGKFELHLKAVNLDHLVDEVKNELIHFARAHNVDIINHLTAQLPAVAADGDKIREVVLNLVTNAIKYSQPGHHEVVVRAAVKDAMVELSVQDQGMGIPEKAQAHMFEKFYRADNAVESQTEGSGLGLYIAREIIRLHGGDIWLTSQAGVGTTVYFNLPIYGH